MNIVKLREDLMILIYIDLNFLKDGLLALYHLFLQKKPLVIYLNLIFLGNLDDEFIEERRY